jgi:signal transduction histidine kinase
MSRFERLVRGRGFDALVLLAALAAALEVALAGEGARTTSAWFAAPAAAAVVLPLLGRRRHPFAAPATVWALATALSFADGHVVPNTSTLFVAGMAATFLLGQAPDAARRRLGLAVAAAGVAIVVANDPGHSVDELILEPIVVAAAWLAGLALRERAVQASAAEERAVRAEREREAAARLAVAEERARIARELHDIVAHAVSVMVLQVGAVRHRLPDDLEADREALMGVESTGRDALGEMRRLLGAMRESRDEVALAPQPGLAGVDALLEDFRRAGLPVDLRVEGEPLPLPPPLDLSAYRIVQEALTNTLKHARAAHADVAVRYAPRQLEIEVRDDGRGEAGGDGLGHGLVGIRERVKVYGGEMRAGAAAGGGFVLTARIPLDAGGA